MAALNLNEKYKNILIIEDDEFLCHLYAEFFKEEKINIELAHSLTEAEALLSKIKYDLAIIDWNIKGKSVSQLINSNSFKDYVHFPILIITGYSDHEDFDRNLLEKFDVLYKPFSMDVFKSILIDLN